MAWEPLRVYNATMAAGATLSVEVDLKRYFRTVRLLVPTHASASDWYIQACEQSGGTFRRIASVNANTATVQLKDFTILSAVSNRMVEIPALGARYVKVEASTANVAAIGFKFICGG